MTTNENAGAVQTPALCDHVGNGSQAGNTILAARAASDHDGAIERVCANCRAFGPPLYDGAPTCRRHAPTPNESGFGRWPTTHSSRWCLEWIRRDGGAA